LESKVSNSLIYFFFQAEDGIRDFHVTGVQTCALPICQRIRQLVRNALAERKAGKPPRAFRELYREIRALLDAHDADHQARVPPRSEERRVGKECSTRESPAERKNTGRRCQYGIAELCM